MTKTRVSLAVIAVLLVTFGVWWPFGGQHWLAVHTGTVNEPGPYYGFWSGFGSDLGEYVLITGVFTNAALLWRKHTCHAHWWCWRHPHHQVGETPYFVCAHHHPADLPTVAEALAAEMANQAPG